LAAPQSNISELFRRIVQFARVVLGAVAAADGILIEKSLGLFDSCERQVMRLDFIAVILHHPEIHAGGVEHTNHHHRQERQTPEQSHQDRSGCASLIISFTALALIGLAPLPAPLVVNRQCCPAKWLLGSVGRQFEYQWRFG
jgi:hypothetical protein